MKIAGVTVCYNESKMVKYVMPYWERIGIDKLIVYDNMSTDNTVELLKQYSFVEVRTFDTGGKFDDPTNSRLKKEASTELTNAGYDWIYHGDFDEVIYCDNPDFRAELKKIEDLGGNVLCRDLVHPFTSEFDIPFDETKLIHEQRQNFLTWYHWTGKWGGSKVLMHNAKQIKKISFTDGMHDVRLSYKENDAPVIFGYPFITFHLKFVDLNVLEENSHAKHERILWQLDMKRSTIHKKYIQNCYNRTIGDKLHKTLNKLIRCTKKVDTTSYNKFLEKYNNDIFIVNYDKCKKHRNCTSINYNEIDKSIFYTSKPS